MDFALSPAAQDHHDRLSAFLHERIVPAEHLYEEYRREKGYGDHTLPPVVEELKAGGCGTCSCPASPGCRIWTTRRWPS